MRQYIIEVRSYMDGKLLQQFLVWATDESDAIDRASQLLGTHRSLISAALPEHPPIGT